jgi:hypothetical protein
LSFGMRWMAWHWACAAECHCIPPIHGLDCHTHTHTYCVCRFLFPPFPRDAGD